MAGITLADAEAQLAAALEAQRKVLAQNQSYTMNGRGQNRADLNAIQETIKFWDGEVKRLSGESRITRKVVIPIS